MQEKENEEEKKNKSAVNGRAYTELNDEKSGIHTCSPIETEGSGRHAHQIENLLETPNNVPSHIPR